MYYTNPDLMLQVARMRNSEDVKRAEHARQVKALRVALGARRTLGAQRTEGSDRAARVRLADSWRSVQRLVARAA